VRRHRTIFAAALLALTLLLAGSVPPASAATWTPAVSAPAVSPPLLPTSAYGGTAAGRRIPASFSLPLPGFPSLPGIPSLPVGPGGLGGGPSVPSLDLGSLIGQAINEWFTALVKDAINPAMLLVGRTLLSTPQVTDQPAVQSYWQLALGVADSLLVLVIIAAGALVMFHESLQTRYALKDVLGRIVLAAILANTSLLICGQMVSVANALASALLGNGVNPEQAGHTLQTLILQSIESGGIFLVLLGLVAAAVIVALLIVHAVVVAVKLLGVVASPLCLLAHGHPATEGLAQLWWRVMIALLGVQVAQALVLAGAVHIFFAADGQSALGFGTGGLSGLLLVLCLLVVLFRIPFWAKELALSPHRRSDTARLAKTYVAYRIIRGALGGV
jgi:hypothetical protein